MSEKDVIAPPAKNQDEFEFLPAALEVLESPPAPFGRIIAFTISAFFVQAIVWAWIGTVDVVATMQGQTIPTGKVKYVQPLEPGLVRAIHVEEGQFVNKGDLLIELDPTESVANIDTLYINLSQAKLSAASSKALLGSNPTNFFVAPKGVDLDLITNAKNLIREEHARYQASLSAIKSETDRANAAIRSADIQREKLKNIIPLLQDRLEVQEELLKKGITHKPVVLALKQELFEQNAALGDTAESKAQNKASIETLKAREAEIKAAYNTEAGKKLRDSLKQIAILDQDLKKELQRREYRKLRAPASGLVHQLSINTIGAVVNSADRLMTIVPRDAPLVIEAIILNKDIGFVEKEQIVEIKFEAFPFTRYGTITGKLYSVSDDAIIHEKYGPIYKAKVNLDRQQITINGKQVNLAPGMTATVEVKTGTRKILEFFLSPLLRYRDEAIRER